MSRKNIRKQHEYIIKNADKITEMYLKGRHKTKTAEHFGIAVNSVDRALHTTGNANFCSKWFITTQINNQSKTKSWKISNSQFPHFSKRLALKPSSKFPKKQILSKKTPTFEEFDIGIKKVFEFLFEIMNRATRAIELEEENKRLTKLTQNQDSSIQYLQSKNKELGQLKLRWELIAKELKREMKWEKKLLKRR